MIFDLFKGGADKRPSDVKGIREVFIRFIKDELQKAEGGEGGNIKGLHLFISCGNDEKHLYEAAVYQEHPELFRNEIQKIADDYALNLPADWAMEIQFNEDVPSEAIQIPGVNAALFVQTKKHNIKKSADAYIRVLSGEAEKEEYFITSTDGVINVGREKRAQAEDGFFRLNHIAFPGDSASKENKYISRQHAHIEWDNDNACFILYADDGGIPPRNKIKIRSVGDENLVKLNSTHIGHKLKEGDQVILGESAVIEFSYQPLQS